MMADWMDDLLVRAGGRLARHVIVLDLTDGESSMGLFAARLLACADEDHAPWILAATSSSCAERVLEYYSRQPGADAEHDGLYSDLVSEVPLDHLELVHLYVAPQRVGLLVADAVLRLRPYNDYAHARLWHRRLRAFGYSPQLYEHRPDDEPLFAPVTYATGEQGSEQVLG